MMRNKSENEIPMDRVIVIAHCMRCDTYNYDAFLEWLYILQVGNKVQISDTKPLLFYEKENQDDEKLLIKNKTPRLIEYDLELPLVNELNYFIEIINGNPIKKANIHDGLDVIKILEMATKSLNK